ncbi:uncharacterized protein LOC132721965 [Ruditapes philippinarum]|uniref:uncharacterized protein LOC132721965 n=1 Tax=Ruditapes philippinarum TaxID=129788 RepID=UPI00295B15AA|nr:uncharacterized protein LOC132721965 [Ruditapes philippinarum]
MTHDCTLADTNMAGTNIQITHHVTLCLFIYVVVCNCISSFTTASAQRINILPTDPAVCTGDNITFTCSLETTTNAKNQIKPVLSSESLVASTSTHLVDYGTAEITLFNVSGKHDHVAVCCILDNTDEICDMLTEASSILNVYPLPIEVQNFSCLVENYDRSLNCSWSYGKIYERFKEPEVTLLWKSGDSPWMHCPYLDIENGICFWENTEPDFTFREIQMKVSLEQTCGKSAESHFLTDTSKIVKPNPVVEFSSNVKSSTCIEIKWQSADKTYPKRHTVKVSGRWKDDWVSYKS